MKWRPLRSKGSLGTWRHDSPIRFWNAKGTLLRTFPSGRRYGPDSMEVWTEDPARGWVPALDAWALDDLDAVGISAAYAAVMFPDAFA